MNMASSEALEKLQRADHDTLIRVETKMDSLTNEMRQTNATNLSITSDHEARLRVLEVSKEKEQGSKSGGDRFTRTAYAVLGLLIGLLTAYIIYTGNK